MNRKKLRSIIQEWGFNEFFDVTDWSYFQYPSSLKNRHPLAQVSLQFYEPRSDLNVRIRVLSNFRWRTLEFESSGFVKTEEDVEKLVAPAMKLRLMYAARMTAIVFPDLVPEQFRTLARESDQAAMVLADWLLEHGIKF